MWLRDSRLQEVFSQRRELFNKVTPKPEHLDGENTLVEAPVEEF